MTNWPSSPTREAPGLSDLQQNQKKRANQMCRPMSSPIRNDTRSEAKDRIRQELKNLRDSVREAKLELKREKILNEEDAKKRIDDMEAQAAALTMDLDLLIEEEDAMVSETKVEEEESDEYDKELEDYLAQEELELEAQLRELSLL